MATSPQLRTTRVVTNATWVKKNTVLASDGRKLPFFKSARRTQAEHNYEPRIDITGTW